MSFHEPKPIANVVGWVGDTPPPATASRDMAILDALHVAHNALGMFPPFPISASQKAHAEREKALTKLQAASAALRAQPFDGLDEASSGLPF
jgi:hypothetical protein